ncbi:MAG: DUF421 domain-containing protein [Clostridia bacterium]|nr:DUF421 domain-containing protein [Clostridia bacterium]
MKTLQVLGIAALSFAALFLIAKIMGKKQLSQLEFIDYVVGISIGSTAAQMSADTSTPFYHYLISMGVYLALDVLITLISRKTFKLKGFFKGMPLVLINDGKLLYENLKKSKLDINELLALCRIKNYFNINDIAFCIFETNGEISVLPKSHATPVVSGDMNIKKEHPNLSIDFIIDGAIISHALREAGKSKAWLLEKLKEKNAYKLEDIALVNFDIQKDDIAVYFKN